VGQYWRSTIGESSIPGEAVVRARVGGVGEGAREGNPRRESNGFGRRW
jgi:hypothetical protein